MRAIPILRITVPGGVLLLTPIVVLVFILGKAFNFARQALKPVVTLIPDRFALGATTEAISAIVLIAHLVLPRAPLRRTRLAQRIVAELEFSAVQGSGS